jgi:hypothetical protein
MSYFATLIIVTVCINNVLIQDFGKSPATDVIQMNCLARGKSFWPKATYIPGSMWYLGRNQLSQCLRPLAGSELILHTQSWQWNRYRARLRSLINAPKIEGLLLRGTEMSVGRFCIFSRLRRPRTVAEMSIAKAHKAGWLADSHEPTTSPLLLRISLSLFYPSD